MHEAGVRVMRFQSMASAFDDAVKAYGPCESSGSEHSAEEIGSLSDMVNSFMEKDFDEDQGLDVPLRDDDEDAENHDQVGCESSCEIEAELRRLVSWEKDTIKGGLVAEVETAKPGLDDSSSNSSDSRFRRQLMSRLRGRELDAGLCKSKWQKSDQVPAGEYEYIDINIDGARYIVELSLAEHFTIARPTSHYASLLETLPEIFVGTAEELKQVVKLMCKAMKVSMGARDMKVPPWRTYGYMKAKWFGSYKRTLKPVSSKSLTQNTVTDVAPPSRNRSVGFEVLNQGPNGHGFNTCRDEISRKTARMKHGLLAAAFSVQHAES